MIKVLKKLGFAQSEIKIYESLIDLGNATINKIHEKTAIERRYIYDVLNKLIEKGFVSYNIEKGKKSFQPANPKRILGYLEEKEEELTGLKKEINEILPEIIERYIKEKEEIKIEIFRGKESMKSIGEDLLECKDNYFIGGNGSVEEYLPFYWPHFNKKRIKKKVVWHDLIIEGSLMKTFKDLSNAKKKLKEIKYYEYRMLPPELASPHVISIYGSKVAFTLWSKDPFTLVIKNKNISESYLNYFKFLWKIAKR